MKEKYQLSLEVIEKDEEDNLFDKIEKVFITFNSMEAKDLVQNELGLLDSSIDVVDGGARGMRVTVKLAADDEKSVSNVEKALATYLFEAVVEVQ